MSVVLANPGRPFRTVPVLILLVLTLGVLLVTLAIVSPGGDPRPALGALWRGSLGGEYALVSGTLVRAVPLMLTGLAVSIAFRAGVLNIGAEGQLLVGAAAATAVAGVAVYAGWVAVPLALIAGAVAGAGWGWIAGFLRARFEVLEVISTILLNFVALNVVGWLVRGPLQEPQGTYPQSEALPEAARLIPLIEGSRLHWGILLAVAFCIAAWFVISHTELGFRLRASGFNAVAARSAGGIDSRRMLLGTILVSGAIAGTGGAVEVQGVTFALYENISPGYGYTAIAVALLARLNPLLVLPSAVFFGALESGAAAMQREAGVPAVTAAVVEATLVLLLLAADRVRATRAVS
jgi:general nucleoside transport system permease protein